MTFNVKSLGCKVNTYESEYIHSLFINKGYVFNSDQADIFVVNTCTVTNQADRKSRQVINSIRRDNPNAIIVACGCFVQNCFHSNTLNSINADIIIGNKDKSKIVEFVEEFIKEKHRKEILYNLKNIKFEDMQITNTFDRTRAFVKIQDGCNNYCTYCVIPYVRGPLRSKDHNKVIEEINQLVKNGYKEIVLTGIHTGAYNDNGYVFSDLLKDLIKIKNLIRLRISSIEIVELNDEVLKIFEDSDILVPHLHIPLQSGSNNILKLMNRRYDKEYFLEKVKKIRSIKKDISLTTDVIVGFPSETLEEHNESMKFIKEIGFTKVHVFPYSDRYNTVASKIINKVDGNEKKRRTHELLQISDELENNFYKRFYNIELPVLFEEKEDDFFIGHTSNYIKVKVSGDYKLNEISNVVLNENNIIK